MTLTAEQLTRIKGRVLREARRVLDSNPDEVVSLPDQDALDADVQAVAAAIRSVLISGSIAVSGHPYQPRDMYVAAEAICHELYQEQIK
ncbi:MAG: hypothetical protein ACFB0C_19575 [Leptolyngbyaceae cyanobacterium]